MEINFSNSPLIDINMKIIINPFNLYYYFTFIDAYPVEKNVLHPADHAQPNKARGHASITEEPDYTTDDYHDPSIPTNIKDASESHISETDEYVIENPVRVLPERISVNINKKKRRQKPPLRKPADLPPFDFKKSSAPVDNYQPSKPWVNDQEDSYHLPFLEHDSSQYEVPTDEYDSGPILTEDTFPVHHFPDSNYQDPKPTVQLQPTYYYSVPVLESPNNSEYLPPIVEIKNSYVKNKEVHTFVDKYKSSKSLSYPREEEKYQEYKPYEEASFPQYENPNLVEYPLINEEKAPLAYYESHSGYNKLETPPYYHLSSTELIPELKDIIRDPNWDVKDFSRWKDTFHKPYGGTLSGDSRGHGRQYPLPVQGGLFEQLQNSEYYMPYAPVDKILEPSDFQIPAQAPVSSHFEHSHYSYYPVDSVLNVPERGVETPRPFDIKFDQWLDTSGVEAFGLQVPSDTYQQYEYPPSNYHLEDHFESLSIPKSDSSTFHRPSISYEDVKVPRKEEQSFTYSQTFEPQVSVHYPSLDYQ